MLAQYKGSAKMNPQNRLGPRKFYSSSRMNGRSTLSGAAITNLLAPNQASA